jgi:hypothetical protein
MHASPKQPARFSVLALAAVSLFSGCSSPQIPARAVTASDPLALKLLAASQQAHGGDAFARLRDLSVRYDGRWSALAPRVQPVLVDAGFRSRSEERILLDSRVIAQEHSGPKGRKSVVRGPDRISVVCNGVPATDHEVTRAAALVADAYQLFLLGPFYFERPGVTMVPAGEGTVDRAACDRLLAVLRPGFGQAEEDRVLLFIDRGTRQLRRVRMSLNGLDSTRGAEVDVTFRGLRRVGGILWPTDFDERIRVPFDAEAHRWQLLGIDLNRGIRIADISGGQLRGRAAAPAAPLPPG